MSDNLCGRRGGKKRGIEGDGEGHSGWGREKKKKNLVSRLGFRLQQEKRSVREEISGRGEGVYPGVTWGTLSRWTGTEYFEKERT